MIVTFIFRKSDLVQLHSPQIKHGMSKNEISSPSTVSYQDAGEDLLCGKRSIITEHIPTSYF